MDILAPFIEDCCELGTGYEVKSKARYRYEELVNSIVNINESTVYKNNGGQEGTRSPIPSRESDFKFTAVGTQGFVTVPAYTGS